MSRIETQLGAGAKAPATIPSERWRITPSDLSDKDYWEFSTGDGRLTGGLDSNKS